jgi:glycine cleavage system H protein
MSATELPADLSYTAEHEWVRQGEDGIVTVGITDYAQQALGDVVFVQLPQVGDELGVGAGCGEIESTKSVSDLYSPLSGVVLAVNDSLDGSPELVNSDPYGEGWMFTLRPSDESEASALLSADAYQKLLD